jgi:LCP family protein required for cell wall assembly
MVMRTDPDAGHIRYLSIPRDLRVDLPGHGFQKINAAYAFNGQAGIIKAVSRGELGIPINHIMLIDFRGLGKLVDSLGGIDVTNPTRLVNCPYAGGRTVSFPRGHIHLNGARALEFSRVRKCDSDFERARRQQIVVAALKGKVLSFSALPMAPWRGARVVRALGTDLGAIDLAKLGWLQARLKHDPKKDEMVLAGRPENIGGQSFVILKPDQAERQLAQFVRR